MKAIKSSALACVIVVLCTACTSREIIHIQINEPWQEDFVPGSFGVLPAKSPEAAHNALLRSYRQDSDQGRRQAVKYANAILEFWPEHTYSASSSYLAGWSILLAESKPYSANASKYQVEWEHYIDSLLTASYYFVMSARKDKSADGFWTFTSGAPLTIIHEGFENTEALGLYLNANQMAKISYQRNHHENILMESVNALQTIEAKYPEWAIKYGINKVKEDTINAVAVQRKRGAEALLIFDNE